MIKRALLLVSTALFLGHGPTAWSAPCAGFTDVDALDPFCPTVEWIRNRGVTVGCGGTLYCRDQVVSRLSMAAFMNRLGTALTPATLKVDIATGTQDLDLASNVVCQTGNFPVSGYPRRAYVDLAFAATATVDVDFAAEIVATTDNGATWTALTALPSRGSVNGNRWSGIASFGQRDLEVGETVRFGVRLSRDALPGAADLADSRCKLVALVYSRDGISSPL